MNKVLLADRLHWTLEQIDAMDVTEFEALMAVLDGLDKGREHVQKRGAGKTPRGRRR